MNFIRFNYSKLTLIFMITIIGSGKVGGDAALFSALKRLDDQILLLDVAEGLPQGEAMDINHMLSEQGIDVNNPVIVPNGVIGKINSVSENSSLVQLINDSDFRIGVRFLPSGETGILRWKSNNICEVREVYKNSNINVGDRVITSGLSDIFPEDLPVGTVTSVANDRTQFQKIVSVKIDENLNALTYVFVIVNRDNIL